MTLKIAKAALLSVLVTACSPEAEHAQHLDTEAGAVDFGADARSSAQADDAVEEGGARLD